MHILKASKNFCDLLGPALPPLLRSYEGVYCISYAGGPKVTFTFYQRLPDEVKAKTFTWSPPDGDLLNLKALRTFLEQKVEELWPN
jgi:hypothetical protein